ncbi:MAG: hypothetical protein HY245_07775 [Rhizobiales bacterium]|nr:hypothetical protein [Hyphomicrobiales bacterium]
MIESYKIGDWRRPSRGPRHGWLALVLAAAMAILASLVLAPEGYAASGTPKDAGAIVGILHPTDCVTGAGLHSGKPEMANPAGCPGHGIDHTELLGWDEAPCPAHDGDQPGVLAWQSPGRSASPSGYVLPVTGAPNSLPHRRLNRPPIVAGLT